MCVCLSFLYASVPLVVLIGRHLDLILICTFDTLHLKARITMLRKFPLTTPFPVKKLIEKLYNSKQPQIQIVAAITGGGGHFFQHALSQPGASSCILELTVPYYKHSCLDYLNKGNIHMDFGFCSPGMAKALSLSSLSRAMELTPILAAWPYCVGCGTTATLVSHYKRRGGYRIHTSATTALGTSTTSSHELTKGARERHEEDEFCALVTWRGIAKSLNIEIDDLDAFGAFVENEHNTSLLPLSNTEGESAERFENVPKPVNSYSDENNLTVLIYDEHKNKVVALPSPANLFKETVIFLSNTAEATASTTRAKALQFLGWEGDGKKGSWAKPDAPVIYKNAKKAYLEENAQHNHNNIGSIVGDINDIDLIERYPNACFVITHSDLNMLLNGLNGEKNRLIRSTNGRTKFIILDEGGERGGFVPMKKKKNLKKGSGQKGSGVHSSGIEDNWLPLVIAASFFAMPEIVIFVNEAVKIDDGSPSTVGVEASYTGEWDAKNNCPHGAGKVVWENGIIFEGGFRQGKYFGHGCKAYSKGGGYEGNWVDGKRHGRGVSLYGGKFGYEKWTGGFIDDFPHGVGEMVWIGGETEEFQFEAGEPCNK